MIPAAYGTQLIIQLRQPQSIGRRGRHKTSLLLYLNTFALKVERRRDLFAICVVLSLFHCMDRELHQYGHIPCCAG